MKTILVKIKQNVHLAVTTALVLFFLLFILQNTEQVQVAFLFWTISISRALLLLATLLFGVVIGIITTFKKKIEKRTLPTPTIDSKKDELQKTVLEQDAEITKMQSERLKTRRVMEAHETNRIETLGRLNAYDKKQRVTDKELSKTRVALDDATESISSLENEIGRLQDEIEAKELIEGLVQHDLRNALISSVSLPESIINDSNLTDNQKIIINLIRDSGERMLDILNSSLTLYQIEEGTYKKDFTTINLHKTISTVVDHLAEPLSNFKQEVWMDCMDAEDQEGDTFLVYGDEFLLSSIFMNLLTNASEASPPGKAITVILGRNDYCSVAIRNHGEVPESIRDTFFNKMVTSGKKFGTGLGTYSAMAMVKAQDGNIELDCSEPGMTTIYVSLPKPPKK